MYKSFFKENQLFEMSNLFSNKTGLKYTIWIATKSGREKHSARIKIDGTDWVFSISISNNPEIKDKKGKVDISAKDLNDIKQFIVKNQDTLLDHWNGLIDSADLVKQIKKI